MLQRLSNGSYSIPNTALMQVDEATIKGRAAEAGTGVVTDLTPEQASVVINAYSRVIAGPSCMP